MTAGAADFYEANFEKPLLAETVSYYRNKGMEWLSLPSDQFVLNVSFHIAIV
jgi:hypothetical protein